MPLLDLLPEHQALLLELLRRHLPGIEVWAYGSRAKGTAKPWSDLDLVAHVPPQRKPALHALREAFEESDLPFRVDLFAWDEIPDEFRRNIEKERVVLQLPQEPMGQS